MTDNKEAPVASLYKDIYKMHTRCFGTTKLSSNGEPHSTQIVGNLYFTSEGRWILIDCDGGLMPFGEIVKQFDARLICISINNLDYDANAAGTPIKIKNHHDNPCP